MEFEFDPAKSQANSEKHGIDFEQAQSLWRDPEQQVIPSAYAGESRKLLIALREGKLWTAIFTQRERNDRIISVRRSREDERTAYYEY